jgi:eukaryotic-like serine/threonine-protein kinase
MASAGDCVAGKYRLECPLGEGGMGSVWKARHLQLDAFVAIKFQHPRRADAPRAIARFRREARAAARLTNANVVRILDFGVDGDTPYLVMEYLVGESLRARLDRAPRLPPDEALDVVAQAASALDAVHAAGIVHRDLKPSNLFLAQDGTAEILKLIDFGIAKWFDDSEAGSGLTTEAGLVVGSVQYMSPQQARGERVDRGADIWSLAVVAYQLLTGTLPFQGANVPDTLRRICLGDFQAPSAWFGRGSEALDAVFERAFAHHLELRLASAREFARKLSVASRGLKVSDEAPKGAPQSVSWAFGREGSTKTAAATGQPSPLRALRKRPALIAASALLALAGGSYFVPSNSRPTAVAVEPLMQTKPSPTPLLELLPEPLPAVVPAAASAVAPAGSPRAVRRPLALVTSAPPPVVSTTPEPRPVPTRVDPVFGLPVPRAAAESR